MSFFIFHCIMLSQREWVPFLSVFLSPLMPSKSTDSLLAHPRHRQVRFDEKSHQFIYSAPAGELSTGAPGVSLSLPGMTGWLRSAFFPAGAALHVPGVKRASEGRRGGTRVHRQLQHWINCQELGHCECGQQRGKSASRYKTPKRWSPLVLQAIETMKRENLVPRRAELAVVSPSARRGTKLDLVCDTRTGGTALLSIKTGYLSSESYHVKGTLRPPFQEIYATEKTLNDLQLFYEFLLLDREYQCRVERAATLYLGRAGKDGMTSTFMEPLPGWAYSKELQERAMEALRRGGPLAV